MSGWGFGLPSVFVSVHETPDKLREAVAKAIGRQVTLGEVEPSKNWLKAADAALHEIDGQWPGPDQEFPRGLPFLTLPEWATTVLDRLVKRHTVPEAGVVTAPREDR